MRYRDSTRNINEPKDEPRFEGSHVTRDILIHDQSDNSTDRRSETTLQVFCVHEDCMRRVRDCHDISGTTSLQWSSVDLSIIDRKDSH